VGTIDNPQPEPGNVISAVHIGLFADSGRRGKKIFNYLQSEVVRKIYVKHGLQAA